jgi:pentatricopeptide repeat protein
MAGIESENLAREWEGDVRAPELWDALEQIKTDAPAGLASLERSAQAGSALAMMHLAHTFLSGNFGVEKDVATGEAWLRRSAEQGSIEGAYRLANILLADGRVEEAMSLFNNLSERGYAPASFVLGLEFYRGQHVGTDMPKAMTYLQLGFHPS